MNIALPAAGAAFLLAGTALHPMRADPTVPAEAFAEYAADRFWVGSHLMQLVGVALLVVSLLSVSDQLKRGLLATAVRAGAIASLAVAAGLQAVDGIALKSMVDLWAAAPEAEKQGLLHAAIAVRAVEIGFAAMFAIMLGATLSAFALAIAFGHRILGLTGIAGGLAAVLGGIIMGLAGFSELAMAVNMPASLYAMGWYLFAVYRMQRTPAAVQ
jgi:hypothetical protein